MSMPCGYTEVGPNKVSQTWWVKARFSEKRVILDTRCTEVSNVQQYKKDGDRSTDEDRYRCIDLV